MAMSELSAARASLVLEIAEELGFSIEIVDKVYEYLKNTGLIDYDIEKEVLLGEDDE
jgi:DNA-binding transcriptional regulator YhcF (GntR family)